MRARHAEEKGIEWRWADVRDMKEVASDSVDVAFDKGTLDAMIHGSPWSPPDQALGVRPGPPRDPHSASPNWPHRDRSSDEIRRRGLSNQTFAPRPSCAPTCDLPLHTP